MEKNVRVVVRVRPFSIREMEQNQRNLIRVLDNRSLIFDPDEDIDEFFYQGTKQNYRDITKRVNKKLSMNFDEVFDADATNHNVFEACIKPLVASLMDGFNCSVFVYGATGAGKTHTMLGNENCRGITFLTIKELFTSIDQLSSRRKFDIGISYLEVYNEQVMNLLTKSGPLKLREDTNGVVVSGLILKKIENAEELYDLLILGNKNRTQHPTDSNSESSRSHAIFQVHLRMTDKQTSQKRTVKLSMIDLAGSERAASTKCMGQRFKEGASINKSLLALGNCINKLADGLKHIPYRDSNLTRILKDSLGGNCQTLMIANVSPSSLTYEDTYNTLKYASRAKKIRTTLRQNVVKTNMPKEYYVKKVNDTQFENDKLQMLVKQLEAKITTQAQQFESKMTAQAKENEAKQPGSPRPTTSGQAVGQIVDYDSPLIDEWCLRLDNLFKTLLNAESTYITILSRIKILQFRADLKQKAEICSKILSLDGKNLSTDMAKLEASIGKYDKDVTRNESELKTWRERCKTASKDIDEIRNQIPPNCARFLQTYLQMKENEVEVAKYKAKNQHTIKINSIYVSEVDCNSKTLKMCYEIIQDNYLLLRAKGQLDKKLHDKIGKVVKLLQGQRSVKFVDNEDDQNESDIQNLSLHLLESDELVPKNLKRGTLVFNRAFTHDEPEIKKKRVNLFKSDDTFLNPNEVFKIPNPIIPSSTSPIKGTTELDGIEYFPEVNNLDSTFQIVPASQIVAQPGRTALSERDRNLTIKNRAALNRGLISKPISKTKVLLSAVAKENKRFSPNRHHRKSPRAMIKKTVISKPKIGLLNHQRSNSSSSSDSSHNTPASDNQLKPILAVKK